MQRPPAQHLVAFLLAGTVAAAGTGLATHARADLAVEGTFETPGDGGLPDGWTATTGAALGAGPAQSVQVAEGAGRGGSRGLRLTASAATEKFLAVESPEVPSMAGDAWLVSAWVRGRGVTREGRQFDNCGVLLRALDAEGSTLPFGRAPVVATSPVSGTFDWTRVERRVVTPALTAAVRVGAFCSVSGEVVFDDVELERTPGYRGERVVLHARVSDRGQATALLGRAERALAEAEEATGLRWPDDALIHVHLYSDEDEKRLVTGVGGNAHVVLPDQVHVLDAALGSPHEMVHLLAAHDLGPDPSALLGEGLAVAAGGLWRGEPVDEAAARLLAVGRLPDLGALLPNAEFRRVPQDIAYPVAGSFVRFLFAACGDGGATSIYRASGPDDGELELSQDTEESCGGSDLISLVAAWRAFLQGKVPAGPPPGAPADVTEEAPPEPSPRKR